MTFNDMNVFINDFVQFLANLSRVGLWGMMCIQDLHKCHDNATYLSQVKKLPSMISY